MLQAVLSSSRRSVPDMLRALFYVPDGGEAQVSQFASNLYKEMMQRYLMRLRVEFASAKRISICADKSKVAWPSVPLIWFGCVCVFPGSIPQCPCTGGEALRPRSGWCSGDHALLFLPARPQPWCYVAATGSKINVGVLAVTVAISHSRLMVFRFFFF